MTDDTSELDRMQLAYRTAVDEWIIAIRHEQTLASVNHSVAQIDRREQAHRQEAEFRERVMAAKKQYEDALSEKFFEF
jgi:hypothetical protein